MSIGDNHAGGILGGISTGQDIVVRVGIRSVPVGEAMVACVLADHWLRHRAQIG